MVSVTHSRRLARAPIVSARRVSARPRRVLVLAVAAVVGHHSPRPTRELYLIQLRRLQGTIIFVGLSIELDEVSSSDQTGADRTNDLIEVHFHLVKCLVVVEHHHDGIDVRW